jgi:enoyl-CoA hydratase/carnithine racemase
MEFEFIKYDKREHIAYITLNRPERMNALHPACHVEMTKVWDDFIADKAMWVAIVTGAGDKAFSAGNDLRYTAEHRGEPVSDVLKQAKGGFAGITSRYDIYKPIIAADHARFGLPEPRVGLMAGAGGVHRLPRQIPLKIAMGMMLTGKHITAQEAAKWGIANEVVALKDLIPTAERWAREIMECSPVSIQASKQAAMDGMGLSMEDANAKRFPLSEKLWHSKDSIEGPLAFSQKRKPNWTGE